VRSAVRGWRLPLAAPMTTVDHVSRELRLRPRVAVLSAAAGVLLFGAIILESVGTRASVNEVTAQLLAIHDRTALQILGGIVNGLGMIALAATLAFLFTAAKARRPEMAQATVIAAVAGACLAAVAGVASSLILVSKANDFATHGAQTYPQANALLTTSAVTVPQYLSLLGALGLAVGFVLISLNAMRAGLLPKFMGYLGIAAAVASVFFAGAGGIGLLIEVAWLLGLAYLLSGRWPSGDPPAWRTGQAVPWPSNAELREQRQRGAGRDGAGRGGAAAKPARRTEDTPAEPVAATTGTRATTPKRKRKRRK
jgi:Domain of unknown function (DUF4386)